MNKERRIEIARQLSIINDSKCKLESLLDAEQYAFDNIPENLQSSIRGEESQEAIDSLEDAIDMLDEIINVTLNNYVL